MAKPTQIELPGGDLLPILYEDRSVLAVDKPAGWILGPETEELASRNLHLALMAGIQEGDWWARSRNLSFLRFVHRLDAPTTGVLLLSKSRGAIPGWTRLFAGRQVRKTYLAVTRRPPRASAWTCRSPLGPDPDQHGRHRKDPQDGKPALTHFRSLATHPETGETLVAAFPHTGRTHQIRLHLLEAGCPIVGDLLYGQADRRGLALRAVQLAYPDPFTQREVVIRAPWASFCQRFGFTPPESLPEPSSEPEPIPEPTQRQGPRPPSRPPSPSRPGSPPRSTSRSASGPPARATPRATARPASSARPGTRSRPANKAPASRRPRGGK